MNRWRTEASDRDEARLSYERKLFTDTVTLSAYEIETHLREMFGARFSNFHGATFESSGTRSRKPRPSGE